MSTPSPEITRLTQEYLSAATEQAKEKAFQKLRAQREKEALEAMRWGTPSSWYIHELPK